VGDEPGFPAHIANALQMQRDYRRRDDARAPTSTQPERDDRCARCDETYHEHQDRLPGEGFTQLGCAEGYVGTFKPIERQLVTSTIRLMRLIPTFPSLVCTPSSLLNPDTWDPKEFAKHWRSGSGGELDAALFCLAVWNSRTDWSEFGLTRSDGRFDVHTALGNWDQGNREAFLKWAADPFWC